MICDTCGKDSPIVSRVVIDKDYNRANARPVYNCPECFERKNRERMAPPASEGDSGRKSAQA